MPLHFRRRRVYAKPFTLSPRSGGQGHGYDAPQDCLRAQTALTPNAYVLRPRRGVIHSQPRAECPIPSSLLCCTWGDGGASALELPRFTYAHCPAYADENLPVVECVLGSIHPRELKACGSNALLVRWARAIRSSRACCTLLPAMPRNGTCRASWALRMNSRDVRSRGRGLRDWED